MWPHSITDSHRDIQIDYIRLHYQWATHNDSLIEKVEGEKFVELPTYLGNRYSTLCLCVFRTSDDKESLHQKISKTNMGVSG